MEYTIEFYKSSVNAGRTIIHQTTMCEDDETKLKREVTKLSKTIEPFDKLQKRMPHQCGTITAITTLQVSASNGHHTLRITPSARSGRTMIAHTASPSAKLQTSSKPPGKSYPNPDSI